MSRVKINRQSYYQAIIRYAELENIDSFSSHLNSKFNVECAIDIAFYFAKYLVFNVKDKKKFMLAAIKYGLAIESD